VLRQKNFLKLMQNTQVRFVNEAPVAWWRMIKSSQTLEFLWLIHLHQNFMPSTLNVGPFSDWHRKVVHRGPMPFHFDSSKKGSL
jgi:hypothetical protein